MKTRRLKPDERLAINNWDEYRLNFISSTPVETELTKAEITKKKAWLEARPLEWIKYFFPKYASYEFAPFQKKAISRIVNNDEWYEVLSWSRELAKSTIVMFCVMFLTLTGRKKNVMLTAATLDAAVKLLTPYRLNFESNGRLKAFYGEQQNVGDWAEEHFVLKSGVSFTAVGAGQAPRGSRNEAVRPDILLTDDYDTDQDCRNPVVLDKKWEWWERAFYPTRSVSEPTLVVWCGNLIAKDTCVARAAKMADHHDVINLTDADGNSTWPQKNTPEKIERIRKSISKAALQAEYYNNPISEGKIFQNLPFGKVPSLKKFRFIVIYGDPAYSNKKNKADSTKAVWAIGKLKSTYYIIKGFLARETNANYIGWFYQLKDYIGGACPVYCYQENNSLQDPFFEQVFRPLILEENARRGEDLHITPDTRAKMDKATRIEANLEPIDREGGWIFNEEERDNPHMRELIDQFKLFEMSLPYNADGPDCIEGGITIVARKLKSTNTVVDTVSYDDFHGDNRL